METRRSRAIYAMLADVEEEARSTPLPRPVLSVAADAIAEARLRDAAQNAERDVRCDACDAAIEGESYGSGLLLWWRDGEPRAEEPALCEACAVAIGLDAARVDEVEDEEG